jgi:serine O-acetyltransferase
LSLFSKFIEHLRLDINIIYKDESGFRFSVLFHPSFQMSLLYRLSYLFDSINLTFIAKFICFCNRVFCGCDIHYKAKIDGGVLFPHARGVVIGEGVEIAHKCSIFHQTTIGSSEGKVGFPKLEEGVNVYPGTVIAGNVVIGEWSRVGPNVYLTESIPSHTRISPPDYKQK